MRRKKYATDPISKHERVLAAERSKGVINTATFHCNNNVHAFTSQIRCRLVAETKACSYWLLSWPMVFAPMAVLRLGVVTGAARTPARDQHHILGPFRRWPTTPAVPRCAIIDFVWVATDLILSRFGDSHVVDLQGHYAFDASWVPEVSRGHALHLTIAGNHVLTQKTGVLGARFGGPQVAIVDTQSALTDVWPCRAIGTDFITANRFRPCRQGLAMQKNCPLVSVDHLETSPDKSPVLPGGYRTGLLRFFLQWNTIGI